MNKLQIKHIVFKFLLVLFFLFPRESGLLNAADTSSPLHVYLTWDNPDTSHTVVINFHQPHQRLDQPMLFYDSEPRFGVLNQYRYKSTSITKRLRKMDRDVYVAKLKNLSPGTTYYFTIVERKKSIIEEKKFRTLPDGDSLIRWIDGGDMGTDASNAELLQAAARTSPDLAVIGGDISYDNGNFKQFHKWDDWLELWNKNMLTPDGRLIPMVLAIGNHEIGSMFGWLKQAHSFFFLFEQSPVTHFVRYLGNHTSLIVLDSGHLCSHKSQVEWLEKTLQSSQMYPNRIATYHVPLYPGHRDPSVRLSKAGRRNWAPVFDRLGLTVAFEHHDHVHKRTKKIYKGREATSALGTYYLGDGCFGKETRAPDPTRWYLESSQQKRHFWLVDASSTTLQAQAIDENGVVFDELKIR